MQRYCCAVSKDALDFISFTEHGHLIHSRADFLLVVLSNCTCIVLLPFEHAPETQKRVIAILITLIFFLPSPRLFYSSQSMSSSSLRPFSKQCIRDTVVSCFKISRYWHSYFYDDFQYHGNNSVLTAQTGVSRYLLPYQNTIWSRFSQQNTSCDSCTSGFLNFYFFTQR